MNRTLNDLFEERALSYLPLHISERIKAALGGTGGTLFEIRLTVGADISITSQSGAEFVSVICTAEDMRYIIRSLCGNSVYSHSESMKAGYITTADGIRAGVAGRAVCDREGISAVSDITSVVIRIPHRFQGAADDLTCLLERFDYRGSVLVYSPPGGGKTTLLRELAATLGQDPKCRRVVVVDSRCEIALGLEGINICTLLGYPRHKGIEIAVRTLGADIVICDEISTSNDVEAALECLGSGVTLVASAHGTKADIFERRVVKELAAYRLFKAYYGIEKLNGTLRGKITFARDISI